MIRRAIGRLVRGCLAHCACLCPWFTREAIAKRFLKGDGIEIGALHKPLKIPSSARVKYLDRMPVDAIRAHYPELNNSPLVSVDIVDDGESLATLEDASLDFVVANHFLEHCQNPLKALLNMFRVLRDCGILYLAIPDMRLTFDSLRPITDIDHVIRDFQEGPEWSRRPAFDEYVRLVARVKDEAEIQKTIARYMSMDYSIHYHAWTEMEMMELLIYLRKTIGIEFSIELVLRLEVEIVMILRKGIVSRSA